MLCYTYTGKAEKERAHGTGRHKKAGMHNAWHMVHA